MIKKTLVGTVMSTKMNGSAVIEVTRRTPFPKYKKLIKVSKRYIVSPNGKEIKIGDMVRVVETKKLAKNKFFQVEEVLK